VDEYNNVFDIPDEDKTINIIVKPSEKQNGIDFCVQDFGRGLPEKFNETIFNDVCVGKSEIATGLSLFIIKIIFKSIGGDINLNRNVTKGSLFYITVPIINNFD